MITFLPQNIQHEIKNGETVLEAAKAEGIPISGSCSGAGVCGGCKVKIISGTVPEPDGHNELLGSELLSQGYRLACCTPALDRMVIEVSENETAGSRKKKLIRLPQWFTPELEEAIDGHDTYGVAVDIGTTTLVVLMWNLSTGEQVDVYGAANPQGAFGADVISRINYVQGDEKRLEELQQAVVKEINHGVDEICSFHGISAESVVRYAVVGNTTMSHIFLGVDPKSLAAAPFRPVFTESQQVKASELGLQGSEEASVYVAANIAGHIGSDITAGIITTDIMKKDEAHLFIDIGTNGEIVLSGKGRVCACSTAAGPAFEGSSIRQGMRAAEGAIERVSITDQGVNIETIGDKAPMGICGSGIIDAVGELVRTGIVNCTGKIESPEKLRKNGMRETVLNHIRCGEKVNDFVLYESPDGKGDVLITQKDIREVQLAKAAISAGINIMMKELGITADDLEKVSVAGAFGSYIRISSAMDMGLLPKAAEDRVFSTGNSAGAGASMMLMSAAAARQAEEAAEEIQHIELAGQPDFQQEYMMAMSF